MCTIVLYGYLYTQNPIRGGFIYDKVILHLRLLTELKFQGELFIEVLTIWD